MAYEAKILADSISPDGVRLTTMQVTFPRIVLAEFNTHRMFSRNSASSRAIPVEKMIARVEEDPFIPVYWGKNQKGMQASEELDEKAQLVAKELWLHERDSAVYAVKSFVDLGIHKQIANRLLEPWLWHTVIVTATEWENFFNLRTHKDAQPEIQKIAVMMKDLYEAALDRTLMKYGQWHLPLMTDEDFVPWPHTSEAWERLCRISCARCARVSYLTHDGKRDPEEDLRLADRLQSSGHMSPFEHAATPISPYEFGHVAVGNFKGGWRQYRKLLAGEAVFQP